MDQRHRDIIDEYRNLVCKNLILSDDFYRVLVTHGVFSEGLIKDIKKAPRGEAQSQLLDVLLTRSNAGFGKFCDVLEVTGHHFLSDCLREAENVESVSEMDMEEFVKKLPFISKSIKNDQQKAAVQKYFRDKIHNEVLKQTWRGDISTKERLMVTRQQQIEQVWHHEEEAKIKDKGMAELQTDYMNMQTRADDLRREIKSLHKHIEDMARKHKEDLSKQINFNMANDRHLNRLNERAEDAGSYLMDIIRELRSLMGEKYVERQAKTDYENMAENFNKLMTNHRTVTKLSESFREERTYMSNQLAGLTVEDGQSIKPHFQTYVVRNEESKATIEKKVAELRKISEDQQKKIDELKWVQDQLDKEKKDGDHEMNHSYSLLEKEVENTNQKLRARDEKILMLEKTISDLTKQLKDLEARLSEARDNEKKARSLANQSIPQQTRTPPKSSSNRPVVQEQKPITSHYKPKPTATRTTGVFVMAGEDNGPSSLDAIKGFGIGAGDTSTPPGVRSQGNVQAAVRQAGAMNGTSKTPRVAVNRPTRRF